MSQITDMGTQIIPRYFQGKVLGVTAIARATFNNVQFTL